MELWLWGRRRTSEENGNIKHSGLEERSTGGGEIEPPKLFLFVFPGICNRQNFKADKRSGALYRAEMYDGKYKGRVIGLIPRAKNGK